jgi:TonB-dependent SusC/RagA subfamily outer membrane receptor
LKFSYIGYEDQIIDAGVKAVLNVTMKESTEVLEEVVVVGYGAQKKETLTGAVTVVSDKMLKDKGALSNPAQALQGQVPGVIITRNSAAPGDESWNMKLRGSFSKNNSAPLVIIDGVESDDFSQLNPGDIESINFLKDASAAIYGARAANGVVLVTTKSGSKGKTTVSYDFSYCWQNPWKKKAVLNAHEYMTIMNEMQINDGNAPRYSAADIANNMVDTDWQDEVFNYDAPVQQHH